VTITIYFEIEPKTTPTCVCLTVYTGDSIQSSSCFIYVHSATFCIYWSRSMLSGQCGLARSL